MLVIFLRVTTITDRLERQDERLSAAMVKRLARLEEQVVTWFFGYHYNVAPESVTFTLCYGSKAWCRVMTHFLMHPYVSVRFYFQMSPVTNCTSSTLNKQLSKVFHPLLFCLIRSSSQRNPCSGLWTVWNLKVMLQKKHHQWVSSLLPCSFLIIFKCLALIFNTLSLL